MGAALLSHGSWIDAAPSVRPFLRGYKVVLRSHQTLLLLFKLMTKLYKPDAMLASRERPDWTRGSEALCAHHIYNVLDGTSSGSQTNQELPWRYQGSDLKGWGRDRMRRGTTGNVETQKLEAQGNFSRSPHSASLCSLFTYLTYPSNHKASTCLL